TPAAPDRSGRSLELFIGLKGLAWLGAFVIVLGVAYFMKYAYDAGYLARIPPLGRCLLAALFGAALVAAGQITMRRLGRLAAVGFVAAGLGTWYCTAYACFAMGLVSEFGGLALLSLVSLIGIGLTWRMSSMAIGTISLLGGYGGPLLMGHLSATPLVLPLHLTMLLVVGLGVAALGRLPALRFVALGAHAVVGFLWIVIAGGTTGVGVLPFLAIWWTMVLAEAVWTALRAGPKPGVHGAIASLLATAWFVTLGLTALKGFVVGGDLWFGAFTAGVGFLAGAAAAQFGPGLDGLRRRPRTAMESLAVSLWLQCGVLLTVAVALQFDGFGQTVAWLSIGVASVELGRRLPSSGVTAFGLVVAALGTLRATLLDGRVAGMTTPLWIGGPISVTPWALLLLFTLVAVVTIMLRLRERADRPRAGVLPAVITVVATLVWALACTDLASGRWITVGWAIGVAALLGLDRATARRMILPIAWCALAATLLRWLGRDEFTSRWTMGEWGADATPFLNLAFVNGLALATLGAWAIRRQAQRWVRTVGMPPSPDRPRWWVPPHLEVLPVGVAVLVLLAVSLELAALIQSRSAADDPSLSHALLQTLWWGIGAVPMLVLARLTRWRSMRVAGVILAALASIAWLLADTVWFRITDGTMPGRVVWNAQFGVGAALVVVLLLTSRLARTDDDPFIPPGSVTMLCGLLIAMIGLWLGSLEIDRAFDVQSRVLTGLSVYWAMYAIVLVVIGFVRAVPAMRYAGLGLLGLTVGKVLIVDMAGVEPIYRVASAVIVGILLVATSVLYARVAPRLGADPDTASAPSDPS
ncbi:MAG: DUF2339 domain-containing protein, partial [Phycisphaerales bacterium]|nr:DUF2339 domain-containing protein [Phycisphaerales bacterium]